ncbi:T9SS type A sorting domain-containing protein [bacterium]|nr:T9SS type A sorting domain-containing protein [bacterium]MBU1982823.1 T9SS type A sorting domain-containing protein [bacterium]
MIYNPGGSSASQVEVVDDVGYAIGGQLGGSDPRFPDFYLVRTDLYGNVLWARSYGTTLIEHCWAMRRLSDGGYILTGIALNEAGHWDISVVRTEPDPLVVHDINSTSTLTFALSQNYPNPFNSTTTLSYSLARPDLIELSVFDLLGRRVAVLSEGQQTAGDHNLQWNASAFPSGVYLVRLTAETKQETKKVILLK